MTLSTTHASPASLALREVAAQDPGKPALEIDERKITYRDLNEQADRLAQRLARDVEAGERVALRANGTHELAVGFLAIQRAGMIAVPIDPTAPLERVQAILADVEPSLLLSDVDGDEDLGLPVSVTHPLTYGADMEAVPIDCDRGELVSIIYTSGSTGQPKGIMMGREQTNIQFARLSGYQVSPGSRVGALTAGTVTFAELLIGCSLVLRTTLVVYEIRRHGLVALARWLQQSEIRVCYMVPTVLRYLMLSLPPDFKIPSLDMVILGGETPTWEDVKGLRPLLRDDAVIRNAFGQSETASISSLHIPADMPAGEGPLPAGTPEPDIEVAILDLDGSPVPPGERGEIVVRARYLSLGYWRRPELTRATFSELPDGRRQVRTGDAGRMLPDGTLEHLGRLDHLVKIAGNRVELGEVEAVLARIEGVAAAAAAAYTDTTTQTTRLAACVVPSAGARIDPRLLRISLTRQFPGYMVPDRIVVTDVLPQLPGGKVDRVQIAAMHVSDVSAPAVSAGAESGLEGALESIWREVLHVDRVGRDDDFFELGGDSMRAARTFVELERRLGIDRPVSLLAEAPTIASLALLLESDESVWDSLLAVRTEGTQAPLFVVHDGIGSVLYARGLAAPLGPDQPIYGLRCGVLSGAALSEGSLEEVGATYVRRIRALYPNGPYVLYGASLGGVIAMEMARQLVLDGEQVPLVVLGDSHTPGPHLRQRSMEELAYHRRNLSSLSSVERARYLYEVMKPRLTWLVGNEGRTMRREDRELTQTLSSGAPVPASLRGRHVIRQFGGLVTTHIARAPFPERTLLIRTGGLCDEPDRGWGPLLGSSLEIVDVPGTHNDLGRESSGAYVGPAISRTLARLAEADRTSELAVQA